MEESKFLSRTSSFSEPDLAAAGKKTSGFPPGTTVDELWLYRRRRPSDNVWPRDNLKLSKGSFREMKSEYTRRFKSYYLFGSDGNLDITEDFSPSRAYVPEDHLHNFDFDERRTMRGDLKESERLPTKGERPPLIKRHTNLKLEGEFYSRTEQADKFVQYLLEKRPRLLKTPTTLKLEGEMDTHTENRDKYVLQPLPPKPPLYKKLTNLHLEGHLDTLTEQQEKFVRYDVQKRPPFTKKSTNLHLEGEQDMLSEYMQDFIEFKIEKIKPVLPVNHLKPNGFYDENSNFSKAFQDVIHPQIPNLRVSGSHEDLIIDGGQEKQRSGISRSLQRIDQNLEYRNAYIDLRRRGGDGKMDVLPEYRRSYVDFPRKRPQVRRPEGHLASEGEMAHLTEKSEKYIPFPTQPRTEPLKRNTQLKLEGQIECQPEYRKAYIDYLIRERVERKERPMDNLTQPPRRVLEQEPLEKISITKPPSPRPESSPKPPNSATKKSARNRSLSRVEASAFGPKLTVPRAPSRTTSPDSTTSRRRSRTLPRHRTVSNSSDSEASGQKFKNTVLVQNLASRGGTPVPPLLEVGARNRWMRDSSMESSSAFVVLDNDRRKVERTRWEEY